jgi:hypothetical protein
VREQGFTVVIDMRGSTWSTVKPILKVLQEHFPGSVHIAYIIKPDNFWQKQRTSLGSHKYKFEVSSSSGKRFSSDWRSRGQAREVDCSWYCDFNNERVGRGLQF